MSENLFIGCYWSPRKENKEECADKVSRTLAFLGRYEGLGAWYQKGRSQKVKSPIVVDSGEIQKHLKSKKRDVDGSVIDDIGFSFSVWNGDAKKPATLASTCGSYSRFVKNSIVLSFPDSSRDLIQSRLESFENMLKEFVEIWNPEKGVVTSSEYIANRGGGMPWEVGGWIIYEQHQGYSQSC